MIRAAGRWATTVFSRDPLGPGGYNIFGGCSILWELSMGDGSTSEFVPDASAVTICLDDISPDETQVAHHRLPDGTLLAVGGAKSWNARRKNCQPEQREGSPRRLFP
jgi:hypothetical protein